MRRRVDRLFRAARGLRDDSYGIYSVADLAAYEAYRARLKAHPLGQENYAFARREQFIRQEERIFVRLASGPHAKPAVP